MNLEEKKQTVLVHLASGIGNIVLATPLLAALNQMGFIVDLLIHPDYPETSDLLRDWSIVREVYDDRSKRTPYSGYDFIIPAVPPFYWSRFARLYRNGSRIIRRPPDSLFYQNEQGYYLAFAHKLGYPVNRQPYYYLALESSKNMLPYSNVVVLAPGSKTGEMSKKRWPYFPQLAERLKNVVIVGTEDDGYDCNGLNYTFPKSVQSLVGKLSLKETAKIMAVAAVVVGNDNGLSHLSAAIGTTTVMIFGPTPDTTLGPFPPNVKVIRSGRDCEPCWFNGKRFEKCQQRIDCLNHISADRIEKSVKNCIGKRLYENRYSHNNM